jgi:hypothetical protein
MAATYMIVKIPEEMLMQAVEANRLGQSFTIHIEAEIASRDEDLLQAAEAPIEIPHVEIARLTQGKPITEYDLKRKK